MSCLNNEFCRAEIEILRKKLKFFKNILDIPPPNKQYNQTSNFIF